MRTDWTNRLVEQLEFHWSGILRPRLEALTDEQYLWEPVPGAWSVRRRAQTTRTMAVGAGELVIEYESTDWPLDAAGGLALLDRHHDRWLQGVRALGPTDLERPCGPAEGPYAEHPFADLVMHINREALHHGAEIALLLDLYAHREGVTP